MEKPVKALEKILREFQQQPQPTNPQKTYYNWAGRKRCIQYNRTF